MTISCSKCAQSLEGTHKFCPECGRKLKKRVQGSEAEKYERGTKIRRWMGLSLIGIAFVWSVAGLPIQKNWLNFNYAGFLKAQDIKLELQLGDNTGVWSGETVALRAKVGLRATLADELRLDLQRETSNGSWRTLETIGVQKTGVHGIVYTATECANPFELRLAAVSNGRVIQASRTKEMRCYENPTTATDSSGPLRWRFFTDGEYDSVSTPGCGANGCWAIWVAAPKNLHFKVVMKSGGEDQSKTVSFVHFKPGQYQKVIIPSLPNNEGARPFFSDVRTATAAEVKKAKTPKPRPTPRPSDPGNFNDSSCDGFSLVGALDERAALRAELFTLQSFIDAQGGLAGALSSGDVFAAAQIQQYMRQITSINWVLTDLESQLERCG